MLRSNLVHNNIALHLLSRIFFTNSFHIYKYRIGNEIIWETCRISLSEEEKTLTLLSNGKQRNVRFNPR